MKTVKVIQLQFDNLLFDIFYHNYLIPFIKQTIAPFDYSKLVEIQPMDEPLGTVYWPDSKYNTLLEFFG